MSSSDSEDISNTPPEIHEAAGRATLNLLPEKSQKIYLKQFDIFEEWCKLHKIKNLTENVFLAFFSEKAKSLKASTLWSCYSMIKLTVMVKKDIDISKFSKLIAFLKKQNVGYKAKKSAIFTRSEIIKFLREAPNENYLMWKVGIHFFYTYAHSLNGLLFHEGLLGNWISWSMQERGVTKNSDG